jgi:hypothetical protein
MMTLVSVKGYLKAIYTDLSKPKENGFLVVDVSLLIAASFVYIHLD